MHLLRAQSGTIDDGGEAVDLGQDPADIVVLSHADTELALLARVHARNPDCGRTLRLANLARLKHHLSIDSYVERTIEDSKLVVLRLLGGEASFAYGVECITAACRSRSIPLAVLPGDDKPDPSLTGFCTLDEAGCNRLWAYLVEGGSENARNFLGCCDAILSDAALPEPAKPVARAGIYRQSSMNGPGLAILFYRSLLMAEDLEPVDALFDEAQRQGLSPTAIFVASLKDPISASFIDDLFEEQPPNAIINLTSFAVSPAGSQHAPTPLDRPGLPVLQAVLASSTQESWHASKQGLSARDLAMGVALPELDGRILSRAIAFKSARTRSPLTQSDIVALQSLPDRVRYVIDLAKSWIRLAITPRTERNIAMILANYPNQDARLANGVGLDTPESAALIARHMLEQGYEVDNPPKCSKDLIEKLKSGPTNAKRTQSEARLALENYTGFFQGLPNDLQDAVIERWGDPAHDPSFIDGSFQLAVHTFGRLVIGIQPARGYNIDAKATYHDPALVPPHGYLAFYAWLRQAFDCHAIIHLGKHGNLEWLPGKALALSQNCWPEAVMGALPHLYPFIVNDPGEGSQAKRRNSAVIIDHLTPSLTRAESYGPLRDLEALVDEYYDASGQDRRRLAVLEKEILELVAIAGLDRDAGIDEDDDSDEALTKLDAYLCDLKEMQIRDGLHIFGQSPGGELETGLLAALTRLPRQDGASLTRAIADDLHLNFDPLDAEFAKPWRGAKPSILQELSKDAFRSEGDLVERLELLATALIEHRITPPGAESASVLSEIDTQLRPLLRSCGAQEMTALLKGLDGQFVEPGPSGAPTRGRIDVLPTGRNFYSVDTRSVPTPTAWQLGWASAMKLLERYRQDNGRWPERMGISAWGTANMRTGGDDIAQALALMGVRPTWDKSSRRVTGFEILPLSLLDRPRVDITFRVSGFFRDAFPSQMDLVDSAANAVMKLDEPPKQNPLRARYLTDRQRLESEGLDADTAAERASFRVFGSMPGAYGAGLQAMFDERLWQDKADLAEAYLAWGSFAYGKGRAGVKAKSELEQRLKHLDAVIQNQDNREHDILDSDDYYQFQGGMSVASETLSGSRPAIFLNDHSRPETPRIRTLEEEIGRVVRARVVNPKWIKGVMRHGYKGAFEMSATVDYLFAYAATTGAVSEHHFDLVYDAYLGDDTVRRFLANANPDALEAIAKKLDEAIERGLWSPRRNSAKPLLEAIEQGKAA